MIVRVRQDGLHQEVDVRNLADYLSELAGRTDCWRLVLDLSRLQYFSSALIGVLVGLHRRMQAAGGRLVICGLAEQPARVLETMRLDRILHLCPHEDEALRAR